MPSECVPARILQDSSAVNSVKVKQALRDVKVVDVESTYQLDWSDINTCNDDTRITPADQLSVRATRKRRLISIGQITQPTNRSLSTDHQTNIRELFWPDKRTVCLLNLLVLSS